LWLVFVVCYEDPAEVLCSERSESKSCASRAGLQLKIAEGRSDGKAQSSVTSCAGESVSPSGSWTWGRSIWRAAVTETAAMGGELRTARQRNTGRGEWSAVVGGR
jgi:hypothetical protein